MKRSPFQSKKKAYSTIVPVGSPETGGMVYMKKGAITPDENPVDFQIASQRQAQTTMIFLQAVKNCARIDGITQAEARKRIFPGDQLPSASIRDYLEIGQISKLNSLHYEAIKNAQILLDYDEESAKARIYQTARASGESIEVLDISDFLSDSQIDTLDSLQSVAIQNCMASKKISASEANRQFYEKPEVDLAVDLYDYLEPEQAASLVGLQDDGRKLKLESATLFLRHRLAHPIILTESADPRAGILKIEPLRFQVAIGNRFRFGDSIVEADDAANFDSEELKVKPIDRKIEAQEVGFLMDILTGVERLGSPDWSSKDTMRYLTELQVDCIYRFYLQESGQEQEDTVTAIAGSEPENLPATLMTKSTESPNTLAGTLSIGVQSSGNSNSQELQTIDLVATTSEVNLIG